MATIHESAAAAEGVVPLVFPFTRGGCRHVLLARVDSVCLVERTSTHPDSCGSAHYEVIVVQVEPERRWPDGRVTPAHECYPKPTLWGSAGWTYRTHAAATRVFTVLATERDSFPAWEVNCGTSFSTLGLARREAARADAGSNAGHSGARPVLRPPPVPTLQPPDAQLGLRRRRLGTLANCPLGATVQLASGTWVQIVEHGSCVVTIAEPGRSRREVAPGTEVFAQRPMLARAPEVPGA
jgi:hypothetical protein